MKRIKFEWSDEEQSKRILVENVDKVSVGSIGDMIPVSLTLWSGQVGLQIYSGMYEIDDRNEVGFLKFKIVSDPLDTDKFIKGSILPRDIKEIKKLTIQSENTILECGIEIISQNPFYITAGAQPFSLAVSGLQEMGYLFDPAYDIDGYEREIFE